MIGNEQNHSNGSGNEQSLVGAFLETIFITLPKGAINVPASVLRILFENLNRAAETQSKNTKKLG